MDTLRFLNQQQNSTLTLEASKLELQPSGARRISEKIFQSILSFLTTEFKAKQIFKYCH